MSVDRRASAAGKPTRVSPASGHPHRQTGGPEIAAAAGAEYGSLRTISKLARLVTTTNPFEGSTFARWPRR